MAGGVEVIPYSDLPEADISETANWVATGSGPGWIEVTDTRYGTIKHTRVQYPDGKPFDKVNIVWLKGIFVVVFRRNPEKKFGVEYLLPMELRPLIRDEEGEPGNVRIRNIPQGQVKVWENESAEAAAIRETIEETGLYPDTLTHMGDIFTDAANSESAHPFILAEVPYQPGGAYVQDLDPNEQIEVSDNDWFGLEDIHDLRLQCGKTLAGIMLSTGFLGVWNKPEEAEAQDLANSDDNLTLGLI
jgi:ADP-ribose pyrophosphatase YjhB (NUDIX family)